MTRLLVDGNSYLNAALLRGIDHDEGRVITDDKGKQVQVNSARYGVDGFFDKLEKDLEQFGLAPRQAVVVWDGRNAKLRRRTFLPTYKEGRDKAPEVSEQLNIARDMVSEMLYHLGSTTVVQDGMEGDDVLGYMARHLRTQRNIVATADGDLSVLVDGNTDVWRLGELNKNPFGGFPHKYITVYKALVGDTGDKIPGAKGFGDAAFVNLVRTFGLEGLDEMVKLIENDQLHRLREDLEFLPSLQRIIENKEMVATSWRCASLHVDDVNTMRRPLQIRPGMVGQWAALDDDMRVHSLKRFYGTKTLVTASNYAKAAAQFALRVKESPFVPLDIETSASTESDEWLASLSAISEKGKSSGIDVLGHELTGMSMTFGDNTQHTIYMTVDHADSDNITVAQCRQMVELVPKHLHLVIQNRNFELSVLYRTWAKEWMNNGWYGFLPNAIDTIIGGSYVNENLPKGLKERSKIHLGYTQQTYAEVTTLSGPVGKLPRGGEQTKLHPAQPAYPDQFRVDLDEVGAEVRVLEWEGKEAVPEREDRQYRMNELTAARVFDYGCDDTICTGSLHTYYQLVMELENTWQVFLDVETLPEYLTTLAFVKGFPVSQEKLLAMSKRDDESYVKCWEVLRAFLLDNGWDGTICPVFTEMSPANVKQAVALLVDTDEVQFSTKKRKLDGMALDLRDQFPDNARADLVALLVERGDVGGLNKLMKDNFTGDPKISFGSPKQMQHLFYRVIGITPRIMNKMTQKQRDGDEVMRSAFKKRRQIKEGRNVQYSEAEYESLISKSSTDDMAVATALLKDKATLTPPQVEVLEAFQTIKQIMTRRSLFYRTYRLIPHWRDGRVHPSLKQCEAVTRRYSASKPNVQQLPKRGEGKEFRKIILAHHKDAVVVSLDFSGQELRLMAEYSGDENLTSCYVGDNLKDVHSLTAVAAAVSLWGETVDYPTFRSMLKSKDPEVSLRASDLRGDAKTVNFGTQYDMQAESLSLELKVDEEVAQQFIDAKALAFPGIDTWKDSVRESVNALGYSTTLLGARRHLADALNSTNRYEAGKVDRTGPNFSIQGSGAEMAKLAMASMWREGLFTGKFDALFIAPVHDEVVFSVHRNDALELITRVHACMVQPYGGMKIPIISSVSLGRTFGEQIECGDYVDPVAIQSALDKVFA